MSGEIVHNFQLAKLAITPAGRVIIHGLALDKNSNLPVTDTWEAIADLFGVGDDKRAGGLSRREMGKLVDWVLGQERRVVRVGEWTANGWSGVALTMPADISDPYRAFSDAVHALSKANKELSAIGIKVDC